MMPTFYQIPMADGGSFLFPQGGSDEFRALKGPDGWQSLSRAKAYADEFGSAFVLMECDSVREFVKAGGKVRTKLHRSAAWAHARNSNQ